VSPSDISDPAYSTQLAAESKKWGDHLAVEAAQQYFDVVDVQPAKIQTSQDAVILRPPLP
jgi:hypothetical protein